MVLETLIPRSTGKYISIILGWFGEEALAGCTFINGSEESKGNNVPPDTSAVNKRRRVVSAMYIRFFTESNIQILPKTI